jgi:hypothetical protein
MADAEFEAALAALVKDIVAKCKQLMELRGTPEFLEAAKAAATRTKDITGLLQTYSQDAFLTGAKVRFPRCILFQLLNLPVSLSC